MGTVISRTPLTNAFTEIKGLFEKKYPDIKIVGSSGPDSEGKDFEYLWPEMKRLKVDLVDEHFYRSPEWFLNSAKRYDSYDRQGPQSA